MKIWTLAFSILAFKLAFGTELTGRYEFSGDITAVQHKVTEVVHHNIQKERLKLLRSQHYTCARASGQFTRCYKFLKEISLPASQEVSLKEEMDGFRVSIYPYSSKKSEYRNRLD